jgi:N-acetylneuraminate synthase
MSDCQFVAEVSSNHHQDLNRCFDFIKVAAQIGCDAVKFQLFKVDSLFAPEILKQSPAHRDRKQWELPEHYIPELAKCCRENNIDFSCTPFYLEAVELLAPYVSFFKIASYELLWDNLLIACAKTGKPVVISTGMATEDEITHAVEVLKKHGSKPTILHCVSSYPTPSDECNLSTIGYLRKRFKCDIGWSDHSRNPNVVSHAVSRWNASFVEFHLDLDGEGEEFSSGHCWLPHEIAPVIQFSREMSAIDGMPGIKISKSEHADREWRADPSDGLRPLKKTRTSYLR